MAVVQVFRPDRPGVDLAGRLRDMVTQGRRIAQQERTRWTRNRAFFQGQQYLSPARSGGSLSQLAPTEVLPNGVRRDTVNLIRPLTEGRVAMLTAQTPSFEVMPPSMDQPDRDGARLATKLARYHWDNPNGWNVAKFRRELALAAEQDGLAFWCVMFDPTAGGLTNIAVSAQTGQPIVERDELEAMRDQDPDAQVLWRMTPMRLGEVVFRVVRAGSLAVDPSMTSDWRKARWVIETERRRRVDVEAEYKVKISDLIRQSTGGVSSQEQTGGSLGVDDGQINPRYVSGDQWVTVHRAYILSDPAGGEFPRGAFIVWVNQAPGAPLVSEPYDDTTLPYGPYVPRSDGGHILRSQATVDQLIPLQRRYNRCLSALGEHLDLVARPPLLLHGGSVRSKSVFNEERVVVVNPGMSDPRFMQVPPEPTGIIQNHMGQLEHLMDVVAVQSAPARGFAPGGDVTSGVSFDFLTQQTEIQLGGTAAEFTNATQAAISRALRLVARHYVVPRVVGTPGVEDQAEFSAFRGEMLRGATDFKITGDVLPKNKAAEMQRFTEFMQYSAGRFDATPFMPYIVTGDMQEMVTWGEQQGRRQERENDQMRALGRHPNRDAMWQEFTKMRDAFVVEVQRLAAQGVPNPRAQLEQMGVKAPTIMDMARSAGIKVPQVRPWDHDDLHIMKIEEFGASDGFEVMHPAVQQALLEHLNEHLQKTQQRLVASGAMQAPPPPPGAPSPPSQNGAPPPEASRQLQTGPQPQPQPAA